MGIFDSMFSPGGGGLLGNPEDPQQAGMMNMAMGLLSAGGPSTKPINFGQAVAQAYGQGMQGYHGALQSQRENALRDLQMRQGNMGLQKSEMEMQQYRETLERNKKIRDELMGLQTGQSGVQPPAGASGPPEMPPASFAPGGGMSPKVGGPDWMQSFQAQQLPQLPPSMQATAGLPQSDMSNIAGVQSNRLLREAEVYSRNGAFDDANKRYEAAAKLMPQVDKIEAAMKDGKPVRVISFKDGREVVSQFAPTPKFHYADLGGQVQPINEYTGETSGRGFKKTATPGEIMTDARSRELAQIQRDQGKIPPGYRMSADGARMEAIPGGPADLGKALPNPAVKELGGAGTAVENTRRLSASFKPEYGGHYVMGDASNTAGRVFGDSTGQTQWWQDMDSLQNQTRHELFGSALTKTELAAWEKTSITPRMDEKQIQQNLQRRQEIEARAASKLARSYVAAGYNKAQIAELLGSAAEYVESPAPPTSQAGGKKPAGLGTGFTFLGFE